MTTAGYQLTATSIDQAIGSLADSAAALAASQADLLGKLNALGGDDNARRTALAALAAGTEADPAGWAADALYKANLMGGNLAGVYYGTVQQGGTGGTGAVNFNFDSALAGSRSLRTR